MIGATGGGANELEAAAVHAAPDDTFRVVPGGAGCSLTGVMTWLEVLGTEPLPPFGDEPRDGLAAVCWDCTAAKDVLLELGVRHGPAEPLEPGVIVAGAPVDLEGENTLDEAVNGVDLRSEAVGVRHVGAGPGLEGVFEADASAMILRRSTLRAGVSLTLHERHLTLTCPTLRRATSILRL